MQEHAAARSAYDQVVHDALLFDEASLRAFLELELAPMLADKVPGLQTWPDAAPRVVRLIDRTTAGALCEDVHGGEPFVVGDELLGEQHPPGRLLFGRLVQVDGDDRQFFAVLPTVVEDECTALELARAVRGGAEAGLRIEVMHSGLSARRAA